jgi:nucleoid DNA-binding protein
VSDNSPSISRRKLAGFIHDKLQGRVFHSHIFAITSLLFEEMMNDLKSGKEIKITGLGTLSLKERAPKPFFDVNFREMRISKGTRNLVFSIDPDLRAKIAFALDNPPAADDTDGDDGGA